MSNVAENAATMKMLYPNWKSYPKDSMTPAIFETEDGREEVAFLIMGNPDLIQDFVADRRPNVPIVSTVYPETRPQPGEPGFSEGEKWLDLVIRFEFYYRDATPIFETVIHGDNRGDQLMMVRLLKKAERVSIFVATNEFQYIRFIVVTWNSSAHPVLDKIIEGGNHD